MTKRRKKDPRDSRQWRALRLRILARDGYTCGYCGQDATTVDHILPINKHPDQAMNPENLMSACGKCNSAKGSRSQGVFLARQFTPPVFQGNLSPRAASVIPENPFVTETTPIIN
jgi:5-methylcytosine-specific restriction endonuclease McrA